MVWEFFGQEFVEVAIQSLSHLAKAASILFGSPCKVCGKSRQTKSYRLLCKTYGPGVKYEPIVIFCSIVDDLSELRFATPALLQALKL